MIDPNKGTDQISNQIVVQGTPAFFEVRVIELMGQAQRIRQRAEYVQPGQEKDTLVESYNQTMQQAATFIAISVGKVNGPIPAKVKGRAGSKDSETVVNVSEG